MKKIFVLIFLIALTLVFAKCVLPTEAAPERPPADIFLPQIEDDLPALPLDDFILQVACWPPQYQRCEIFVTRDYFNTLVGIVSPVAYEGTAYRKIGHYHYADHPEFERLIWAEGGEGLWILTDDWRQGTIHYR